MIDTAYTVWAIISRTYMPLTTITYAQLHVNRRSRVVNCWVLWKTEINDTGNILFLYLRRLLISDLSLFAVTIGGGRIFGLE